MACRRSGADAPEPRRRMGSRSRCRTAKSNRSGGRGVPLLERAEQAGFYEVNSADEGLCINSRSTLTLANRTLRPLADEKPLTRMIAHDHVTSGRDALRTLWLASAAAGWCRCGRCSSRWPWWHLSVRGSMPTISLSANAPTRRRSAHQDRPSQSPSSGPGPPFPRGGQRRIIRSGGGRVNDFLFTPVFQWPLLWLLWLPPPSPSPAGACGGGCVLRGRRHCSADSGCLRWWLSSSCSSSRRSASTKSRF